MKLSEKEEAQLGLLTVILSVIYMNNNLMKEDALFSFLERYKQPFLSFVNSSFSYLLNYF